MAGLMAWAELALCGSGVTGYEMCCLGLPMLVVTPVDNQLPVSRGLAAAGLIHHLGWWQEVGAREMARGVDGLAAAQAERARLARAGWEAVDGLGARRVAAALLEECR
jgi:spore coat polysaccharide biosynthesis predicted glycosyltransferase SpsG